MARTTLRNIGQLLLMSGDMARHGHNQQELLGLLTNAALAMEDGTVAWYGPDHDLPQRFRDAETVDVERGVVMPALIDSHTHAVFGGSRAHEYEQRCLGVSYADIAAKGGGIKYTVQQTRAASFETLFESAKARLRRMLAYGVGAVEIKSGYGLDLETERRQLEVIQALRKAVPMRIDATFLGAHEFPAGQERESYLTFLIEKALPEISQTGLAKFCDIFCDRGVYTVDEARRVLTRARELGFKLKIHAEELACTGGALLAAEMGVVSAEHLLQISDEGIAALAHAGVTACLLPGTALFLGKKDYAPARKLIRAGVRVALATDCNPGSCPLENLLLATTLGCSGMGMSPSEALWAVTRGGAHALGRGNTAGHIHIGAEADIAVFAVSTLQEIPYAFGRNMLERLYVGGALVVDRKAGE